MPTSQNGYVYTQEKFRADMAKLRAALDRQRYLKNFQDSLERSADYMTLSFIEETRRKLEKGKITPSEAGSMEGKLQKAYSLAVEMPEEKLRAYYKAKKIEAETGDYHQMLAARCFDAAVELNDLHFQSAEYSLDNLLKSYNPNEWQGSKPNTYEIKANKVKAERQKEAARAKYAEDSVERSIAELLDNYDPKTWNKTEEKGYASAAAGSKSYKASRVAAPVKVKQPTKSLEAKVIIEGKYKVKPYDDTPLIETKVEEIEFDDELSDALAKENAVINFVPPAYKTIVKPQTAEKPKKKSFWGKIATAAAATAMLAASAVGINYAVNQNSETYPDEYHGTPFAGEAISNHKQNDGNSNYQKKDAFNRKADEVKQNGAKKFIPKAKSRTAPAAALESKVDIYEGLDQTEDIYAEFEFPREITIRNGDTLWNLCGQNANTLYEVTKMNPQIKDLNRIHAGQKVRFPPRR